jgi:hypothetical protein
MVLAGDEDLQDVSREELTALVIQLRGIARAQEQTLAEIIAERDAARLLIELCHY